MATTYELTPFAMISENEFHVKTATEPYLLENVYRQDGIIGLTSAGAWITPTEGTVGSLKEILIVKNEGNDIVTVKFTPVLSSVVNQLDMPGGSIIAVCIATAATIKFSTTSSEIQTVKYYISYAT